MKTNNIEFTTDSLIRFPEKIDLTPELVVNLAKEAEKSREECMDATNKIARLFKEKEDLLIKCLWWMSNLENPPLMLKEELEKHLGCKFKFNNVGKNLTHNSK